MAYHSWSLHDFILHPEQTNVLQIILSDVMQAYYNITPSPTY